MIINIINKLVDQIINKEVSRIQNKHLEKEILIKNDKIKCIWVVEPKQASGETLACASSRVTSQYKQQYLNK